MDNIDEYNKISENKMPRLVLIIEDLYDLMMYTDKEVEQYIKVLTQMSRAAGIHVVISTQRPSINVITGVIKSNIPARMAFYVPSYIDSRTIIDKTGAEKLQVNGDIIFRKTGSEKDKRIQTPYITDKEIEKIIEQISVGDESTLKTSEKIINNNDKMDSKVYESDKPKEVMLKSNSITNVENNVKEINVQKIKNDEENNTDEMQEKSSIFNKWWFWVLTAIFVSIIIVNL